ncbi:MAG: 13E12 repeat family protein [Actinobacteria bacterium]|nr:13E12 repeat family protein [Actinomycetota bacterium]MCA1720673.1 13E12 repeat family protein [Actinomycetota bacterium]
MRGDAFRGARAGCAGGDGALLRAKEQLDAHLLSRVRDVEVRQLHEYDALPSVGSWVETQATSVSRRDVSLARRLDRLPAVRRELESGRLSMLGAQRIGVAIDKVRGFLDAKDGRIDGLPAEDVLDGVILRGVPQLFGEAHGGLADDDLRVRALQRDLVAIQSSRMSQVARVEEAFVALATRIESSFLPSALEQLVDALLPQRLDKLAEEAHARRGLALARKDDGSGWRIEGDLDVEAGELLHTALAAAMATDPDNVADTALRAEAREQGREPFVRTPEGGPRRLWERRHDAFVVVLRDWLGSGIAGSRGKVVPHVLVRVGADALAGRPGAMPAVGGSGRALPMSLVKQWLCDSAVTRFVMGIGGRVIEMSHTARTLKPHERRAKLMETGEVCQAAGCHPPPGTPLVPHHPDAFARSRTTSFYDAVMLCDRSHDDLHVGGKTLRLKDGRLLGPTGWVSDIRLAG